MFMASIPLFLIRGLKVESSGYEITFLGSPELSNVRHRGANKDLIGSNAGNVENMEINKKLKIFC